MSILITGANGAVGKDLVQMLANKYKIYGLYRTKNREIKEIKNVKWIKHDLKNKIIKIKPIPKYIIHCAVDQKYKNKNFNKYINSNFEALKNLVNFAEKNKVKLIINFSSVEVYGDIKKKLLDENYLPQNPNIYGLTKFLSERYLFKKKINFINIRLPGILCKGNKNELKRPWLNAAFNYMKKNKSIFVHNIDSKFNNLISTEEIAKFTSFLIKKKIIIRDTFNFVCKNPLIMRTIFNNAKKKLNSKSKITELKNQNKNSFYISTKKLEDQLNYKTQTTEKVIEKHLENFI